MKHKNQPVFIFLGNKQVLNDFISNYYYYFFHLSVDFAEDTIDVVAQEIVQLENT